MTKTPNNFEEKLIKIRDELLTKVTEGIQLGEYILEALALDDFNEAISTLCEEEVKRARISELKGLKMYDCFNEDYTNDPRPAKLVSIRLVELEKDNKWRF